MHTQVSIQHFDYPAQARLTVERRLADLARRMPGVLQIRARLARQGVDHRVELVASVAHAGPLVAEGVAPAFGEALDCALHRMDALLRRSRDRRLSLRRRAARAGA